MARTFIRQDDQIAASNTSSGGYSAATAPSLANYQTSPSTLLDDLNNVRSQLQNFLNRSGGSFPSGNWYDDLSAPITFENGTQRGINQQNQQLHDLERKRVLVEVHKLADVHVGTQATGTLTTTGVFADGETVTIGTQTYTLKSPFVNAANNIDASGTTAQTLENLRRAINGDGVAGTNYGTGTTVNADVFATDTATLLNLRAKVGGTAGNSVATTETCTNASFGGATLSGGAATNVTVFTHTNELPPNTTLAIGSVTTLGTVAAFHTGTFGNHSLDLVAGASAISPKNLYMIVDAATHDPILSSGRRVYALHQSESSTDGSTVTLVTPNRSQLSYVRLNSTGMALEAVPAADISGMTVHYTATQRKALEDLNEQDFLRGSEMDVPAVTTMDRQTAYNNQGTVAVELTTNATLDLNSAGIFWEIRDLVNATLFRITEGSTGGTTTLQVGTDVDTFDVNAIVNDFNAGATFRSGGTRPIAVGTTDGVINSTAGDLRVLGTGELYLDDGNQTGSTWAQTDGIKLSDTTAEWDNFETRFGEVSLLNAIYQAANTNLHNKIYAVVTADVAADTDVSLADTNVDTAFGDLSSANFVNDYDVYLNGVLLRGGANAAANHDYYPGTVLTPQGKLKFEFSLKGSGSKPDQLTLIKWV